MERITEKDSVILCPVSRVSGEITVSGDKSISHRSLIFSCLAEGSSRIDNFLFAQDCVDTLNVFKKLGVKIKKDRAGALIISGAGRKGLKKPRGKLYFGNSGTGMRLMAGVLAAQEFPSVLTGDASLSGRPMGRIIRPLARMGADITATEGDHAPLFIRPGTIDPITYKSPVASAQVKSCILLAGLFAGGKTVVSEPYKSRDHTERMMEYFGIPVKIKGCQVSVTGGGDWQGKCITVPGDFSSAAFFMTAALIIPGSTLRIKNVNLNPTRTGYLDVVRRMGGEIKITNKRELYNEPIGDITVSSSQLESVNIGRKDVPRLIDEVPLIALLASRAKGKTIIDGVEELRKKESNRLHAVSTQLQNMGQSVEEQQNSLVITGKQGQLRGAKVESFGDHRIAMMLAVAALNAREETSISGVGCVDTSFPDFFKIMESVIEK
ncbi:MAG: 3-phosphoshikimate 1-carboxyvinyltransferase [Elusimicrobia bacterium]|nr:3-phosphoshikimate 1-carboxyvinyltransferase [Elusimicrobiota bacterium]